MRFRFSIRNHAEASDADLCALLRAGRSEAERAFREIYRRYASRVHAYCYKIMENKEEAEDLFQETFVKFFTNARMEREMTNVAGYIFRIARNLCLNRLRDRSHLDPLDGIELAAALDNSFENSELLELIARAVEALELDYREPFILRAYENLPYEEIAALTGTSVSNAKSRVFRARQRIRKLLELRIKELD